MTAERRMERLEGGLSPKEATLLWLEDAHAHGSLVDYCAWLLERPLAEAPLNRIRAQALTAVRQAMRGVPGEQVEAAEDQANLDVAFLFEVVMRTNAAAEEAIGLGGLRYGMLFWEMRAISSEGRVDAGPTTAGRWARWRTSVATLRSELSTGDRAFNLLEGRYLDGHVTLFPDTVERWERLRRAVEDLESLGGSAAVEATGPGLDRDAVGAEAERITGEARAHALDILGDHAGSATIVAPCLRRATEEPW